MVSALDGVLEGVVITMMLVLVVTATVMTLGTHHMSIPTTPRVSRGRVPHLVDPARSYGSGTQHGMWGLAKSFPDECFGSLSHTAGYTHDRGYSTVLRSAPR